MKIRIGNMELTDVTAADIDAVAEIIRRFGESTDSAPIPPAPQSSRANNESGSSAPNTSLAGTAADTVLLRKLIEAGNAGMTTDDIGTILGRRGKAAKKALDEWGRRIGLTTAENADSFEFARVGTRRGWRIKASLLDVAKHLMTQH